MTTVALITTIVTVAFALAAFVLFKLRATTAGAVFLVLTLFLALANVKAFQFRKMAASPMTMPLTTVTSAPVKEEDWPPILSSIGSLSAVQGAVVAAELAGVVSKVAFENGSTAKQGDMLVQLDTSAEEAQLRTAEADVELARADLQRARDLAARKVISKAEQDAAESKFNRLQAVVDQMRSNIRKKTIVAPFDGQLGIRQVNVGQSIDARQKVLDDGKLVGDLGPAEDHDVGPLRRLGQPLEHLDLTLDEQPGSMRKPLAAMAIWSSDIGTLSLPLPSGTPTSRRRDRLRRALLATMLAMVL